MSDQGEARELNLLATVARLVEERDALRAENEAMRSQAGPVASDNRRLVNENVRLRGAVSRLLSWYNGTLIEDGARPSLSAVLKELEDALSWEEGS